MEVFQQNTPTQIISTCSQVATGYQHSMILKMDGSLWTYGWNSHGTLNSESTSDKTIQSRYYLQAYQKLLPNMFIICS